MSSFSNTLPVQVEWKPFQIDPGTDIQGEAFEAYCERRWGSSGWTHHLRHEGKKDGANFANWQWWPNTLKGHQFVQYGLEKHQVPTDQTNAILFDAMYEQGENISRTETLLRIAQQHFSTWDVPDLKEHLEQNKGAVQVQQEIVQGRRRYGIQGVPFFVVEGTSSSSNNDNSRVNDNSQPQKQRRPYGMSGAQPPEALLEVFEQIAEEMES